MHDAMSVDGEGNDRCRIEDEEDEAMETLLRDPKTLEENGFGRSTRVK